MQPLPHPVRPGSLRAWVLAARPKTLSAALIPVATAAALAYNHQVFSLPTTLACLAFAALMQVAANFINDLFDFLKGTDGAERLGPERACAQGWLSPGQMKRGIAAMLAMAGAAGLYIIWCAGWFAEPSRLVLPLGVGAACVAFAFLYTTLLSYVGCGDLLVYVFFGLVPVPMTYYALAGTLRPEVWWIAAAIGLVTDTLLILNNFRDRDTDRRSGKHTLIAMLGGRFGSAFYLAHGLLATACALVALHGCPLVWLPLLYVPFHITTWRTMVRIDRGRALNRVLGLTSRNMLVSALLIVVALVV